jgi:ribosome-binding factor A
MVIDMAGQRMRRVNEAIREVLSEAIAQGLKDPRIGFVTVVGVDTSPDLRSAKVYVSVLGDETEREQTLEGLGHCHGYLQSLLGGQLGMKRTPQLTFIFDETIERGMRIEKLLKEIEEQ